MIGAIGIDLLKLFVGTKKVTMPLTKILNTIKFQIFLIGDTGSFLKGRISFPHL